MKAVSQKRIRCADGGLDGRVVFSVVIAQGHTHVIFINDFSYCYFFPNTMCNTYIYLLGSFFWRPMDPNPLQFDPFSSRMVQSSLIGSKTLQLGPNHTKNTYMHFGLLAVYYTVIGISEKFFDEW